MAKGIKTGGRTQGTPNKLTAEVKETIKNIVENEINGLETRLNTLETKERIEFLIKLLPYVLPKEPETSIYKEENNEIPKVNVILQKN